MEIGLGRICYISKYLPQSKSVTLLKGYWWWWPLKEKINQISPSLPHCQYFNYLNYLKYYKCHLSCHNVDGRWSWQSSKGKWSEEIQSLISHLPQSPFTAIIQDLSTVSQNEHLHFSHGVFCNLSPFTIFHCGDQGCTTCGSLAARLRENGERMKKWRGNGERMRKWRKFSPYFLPPYPFPK